ncbi:hypothetical protein AB4Z50_14930 [Paenibacillus sp. 2TAB26]|uniref:hypothetical protein n=1 Tax=Paenibacillus sp. 2TAB26 TaxID=3233005 RepID=UPI003F9B686E
MRRIAFITESSTRQNEPMEAHRFYQGQRSRWVNAVMNYMTERDFPREDIFFLSQYGQRIIGFDEIVEPYPVQEYHPRKEACRHFASKILAHVLSYVPLPFVEIHAGKTVADPLMELLEANGIQYRLYGAGVPLGAKASSYETLIEEERNQRKLKEINREKRHVSAIIKDWTPEEASQIVTEYDSRAQLYGIENHIGELKSLLGNCRQKRKEASKALTDLETMMEQEDQNGNFKAFLQAQKSLSDLHASTDYERIKSMFGKSIAKFTCYLLKRQYAVQAENRINESLLRLQVALLK